MRRALITWAALCLVFAVGACNEEQSRVAVSIVCARLSTWTPAFQKKLAAELKELPPDSSILVVMKDVVRLRDQVRSCQGSRRPLAARGAFR